MQYLKHISMWIITISSSLWLAACQAPSGNSQSELATLRADVDKLNIAVFGDPRLNCPPENIVELNAYPTDGWPAAQDNHNAWHKANGERKDVTTTASGLQYKVIKSGSKNVPSTKQHQRVKVHYQGMFPNGDIFDSSYARGRAIEFPANGVIKGWVEALELMRPCDAWQLYIPGRLAYGEKGAGNIPPDATLLFNVQLLEIKD